MIKAKKADGASVFVIFDSSNTLKKYLSSHVVANLKDIPKAIISWEHSFVYIIQDEVKFKEYGDGSIIFFPKSARVPSSSPIGRPTKAL